jgi:hypothetical protein
MAQADVLTAGELAFDRLNPDFGAIAEHHDPCGHQATHDREAALALGVRVTVAAAQENDYDPVMWLDGEDYRVADVLRGVRGDAIPPAGPLTLFPTTDDPGRFIGPLSRR